VTSCLPLAAHYARSIRPHVTLCIFGSSHCSRAVGKSRIREKRKGAEYGRQEMLSAHWRGRGYLGSKDATTTTTSLSTFTNNMSRSPHNVKSGNGVKWITTSGQMRLSLTSSTVNVGHAEKANSRLQLILGLQCHQYCARSMICAFYFYCSVSCGLCL